MERINKFQPDRTLYLRGFTGFGAAASLCETTANSFKVYGVFRDQADFCVLVIYDADNLFEHYSVKYLPDFQLVRHDPELQPELPEPPTYRLCQVQLD